MPGETKSRAKYQFDSGETLHLFQTAGGNWSVDRYEWLTANGCHAVMFAETVGWSRLRFDSVEEAIHFARREMDAGRAPGA